MDLIFFSHIISKLIYLFHSKRYLLLNSIRVMSSVWNLNLHKSLHSISISSILIFSGTVSTSTSNGMAVSVLTHTGKTSIELCFQVSYHNMLVFVGLISRNLVKWEWFDFWSCDLHACNFVLSAAEHPCISCAITSVPWTCKLLDNKGKYFLLILLTPSASL